MSVISAEIFLPFAPSSKVCWRNVVCLIAAKAKEAVSVAYKFNRLSFLNLLLSKSHLLENFTLIWQASNSSATLSKPFYPALVVETAHVPGTGRFKAYSNGHISVVFSDRTILNLRQAADNKEHEAENSYCQLILANGTVQHFSLTDVEQCTMYQR